MLFEQLLYPDCINMQKSRDFVCAVKEDSWWSKLQLVWKCSFAKPRPIEVVAEIPVPDSDSSSGPDLDQVFPAEAFIRAGRAPNPTSFMLQIRCTNSHHMCWNPGPIMLGETCSRAEDGVAEKVLDLVRLDHIQAQEVHVRLVASMMLDSMLVPLP